MDHAGDLDHSLPDLPGISRRRLLQYMLTMAAGMGLPEAMGLRMASAGFAEDRQPVIWLTAQSCGGCTGSLLQGAHPDLETLLLQHISMDYHPSLMAAAGAQAEKTLNNALGTRWGKFILVIEGSVPAGMQGNYCLHGDRPFSEFLAEASSGAALVIALGSCAAWGGLPSVRSNPTGATGIETIVRDRPLINLPGCAPNPHNLLATLLYFLATEKLPALDDQRRPLFAYGRTVHENCERRGHYDAGRFAQQIGDEGHRKGWCLYKLGCKGPETHANCNEIGFADTGAWPVGCGHPCIGCTEKETGFSKPVFALSDIARKSPPDIYPSTRPAADNQYTAAATFAAGAAIGAGALLASQSSAELTSKRDDSRKARSRRKISASWIRKDGNS